MRTTKDAHKSLQDRQPSHADSAIQAEPTRSHIESSLQLSKGARSESPFVRDGIEASRPSSGLRPPALNEKITALATNARTSMAIQNAATHVRAVSRRTQSEVDAVAAQRGEARQNQREIFPNSLPMLEHNLIRSARREAAGTARPEGPRATPQQSAQAAARERRADRRASRIQAGIDNKDQLTIDPQKYSNYAMNSAHIRGGDKARIITARTGLTAVDKWEKMNPKPAMTAAENDLTHMKERVFNLGKIEREVRAGAPAEVKSRHMDGRAIRMDTKHQLEGPKGSKTVRGQWSYRDMQGNVVATPHLGTIQPSDTSSDEG